MATIYFTVRPDVNSTIGIGIIVWSKFPKQSLSLKLIFPPHTVVRTQFTCELRSRSRKHHASLISRCLGHKIRNQETTLAEAISTMAMVYSDVSGMHTTVDQRKNELHIQQKQVLTRVSKSA